MMVLIHRATHSIMLRWQLEAAWFHVYFILDCTKCYIFYSESLVGAAAARLFNKLFLSFAFVLISHFTRMGGFSFLLKRRNNPCLQRGSILSHCQSTSAAPNLLRLQVCFYNSPGVSPEFSRFVSRVSCECGGSGSGPMPPSVDVSWWRSRSELAATQLLTLSA